MSLQQTYPLHSNLLKRLMDRKQDLLSKVAFCWFYHDAEVIDAYSGKLRHDSFEGVRSRGNNMLFALWKTEKW